MPEVKAIVSDILRQSRGRGYVDARQLCTRHSFSYQIFKDNFVRNLVCPKLGEIGEFDLETGKFFASRGRGAEQLS